MPAVTGAAKKTALLSIGLSALAVAGVVILSKKKPPADDPPISARPLTDSPGKNEDPWLLRARDGSIHLTWFSDRGGNADIYAMQSRDGRTWSEPRAIIAGGDAGNFFPSMAQTPDGAFHLVWFRIDMKTKVFSVWYARSEDGTSWGEPRAITPRGEGFGWVPTVAAAKDGGVWIAWASGKTGNKDVFVVTSIDGGRSWGDPIQVTRDPLHDDMPQIKQKPDGTFVVVWVRYRPDKADYLSTTADIFHSTSADGRSWAEPAAVTDDDQTDTIPELYAAWEGREYFVAWCAHDGVWELPLSDLKAQPRRLLKADSGGYSPRVVPLTESKSLVVWVGKNDKGLQIFGGEFEKSRP